MKRREFITATAAAALSSTISPSRRLFAAASSANAQSEDCVSCRTHASPAEAIKSPREKLAYVVALYASTGIKKPDYLATVDLDPASKTYSQVIHRLNMPNVGDELHHFGWNACSSCHGERSRRFLVIPGLV